MRRTSDPAEIAAALAPLGVRYEQWPIREDVPADADSDTVFAAYGPEIDRLNAEEGFTTVDVLGLHPSDDPEYPVKAKAARAKFLQEHTHDDDDEVRFFVSGSGIFYLHVNGEVHAVYCEKGDLLGVPRGTTHWFDMGTQPAVHRDPLLPRGGRLDRQLHRLHHRLPLPGLRHDRRRYQQDRAAA